MDVWQREKISIFRKNFGRCLERFADEKTNGIYSVGRVRKNIQG